MFLTVPITLTLPPSASIRSSHHSSYSLLTNFASLQTPFTNIVNLHNTAQRNLFTSPTLPYCC